MTTVDDTFEARLLSTPAGEKARWLMTWTRRRGLGLTLEETEQAWATLPERFAFERYRDGFGWVADQLGEGFTVESITVDDPLEVVAVVVSAASGRRLEWWVRVSPEPPHGITGHRLQRVLPAGVSIRPARPQDAIALRDVANRVPVKLTDAMVVIDPGDDYFAACRLMGDTAVTFVATDDEQPIGIHCGVSFPIRLEGRDGTCCLIAHSRLLPERSGGGIWGRLNDAVFDHFQGLGGWQVPLAYVRPDNASAQRLGGAEARWPTRPFRAVIDCAASASTDEGCPATPDDAPRIVELLNHFHAAEEFFVPYTSDRLAERLERAPELYGWHDLRLGERAVVGVWARGERHTRIPDGGSATTTVRAAVLDYGCEPGGETELEALLRAQSARLIPLGITHLGVFSSPASPAADLLRSLAAMIEEYDLMPPGIPEPPSVARHGVYVDPIYF